MIDEDDSPVPLLDQSPQVSGTRIRKQVDRLSVNTPVRVETPGRRKNEIVPGRGIKLGASSKIVAQLQVLLISNISNFTVLILFLCPYCK